MADEDPYSSPSAIEEAKWPSVRRPRDMSRFERAFVLFNLVCVVVYLPWFVVAARRMEESPVSPLYLTVFVTVHLFLTVLFGAAVVIIVRDLCLRDYYTTGQKLMWGLLFFLLWPSIYLYFFMHAWKARSRDSD